MQLPHTQLVLSVVSTKIASSQLYNYAVHTMGMWYVELIRAYYRALDLHMTNNDPLPIILKRQNYTKYCENWTPNKFPVNNTGMWYY